MSWSADKYFSKCQSYWERASASERDSHQFLINVAFACEFIIRGALCKINPALNAATDTDSILFATGVISGKPPRTITMTEAIDRLHRFVPEISEDVIKKIKTLLDARNRELHSDSDEIARLTTRELMPSVYSLMVNVAMQSKQDIKVLLGEADAKQAIQVADAITKDRKKRVSDLIRICKDRFFSLSEAEQKKKREEIKTNFFSAVLQSGHHIIKAKCPACASEGLIVATPVGRSSPILRSNQIIEEVRVIPTKYNCKCCALEIVGLDELISAGFSHEYCSVDEINPMEHFDIDVREYIDEDIVREYHRDMYEYQDE